MKRIDISKAPEDRRLPLAEGRRKREIDRPLFNDELWGEEWYLVSQFSHGPNFLILRENLRIQGMLMMMKHLITKGIEFIINYDCDQSILSY